MRLPPIPLTNPPSPPITLTRPRPPIRPQPSPIEIMHEPEIRITGIPPQPNVNETQPSTPSPPTSPNTPAGEYPETIPESTQQPTTNAPSQLTPSLPPIQNRESPNPRHSPHKDSPSQVPHLPPIHTGGCRFDSRDPSAKAHIPPNPNKPPNWEDMSKRQQRKWNERNPHPGPTCTTPECTVQSSSTPSPQKPANWSNMSANQKNRWRARNGN